MAPPPILTPARIESLLRRRAAGEPRTALARRFGITPGQTKNLCARYAQRVRVLCLEMGVAPPKRGGTSPRMPVPLKPGAGVRRCLRCRADFDSEGRWNQVCARCKGLNVWNSGGDYAVHAGGRTCAPGAP